MMLHAKDQGSRPYGFRQEDFFYVFPYISLCKICDSRGRAIFNHMGIICINLVEVHLVVLHPKYQDSRPCGFRQEFFP